MPIARKHTEVRFEEAIEHHLLTQDRYLKGHSKDYDPELALEPKRVIDLVRKLIQHTQEQGAGKNYLVQHSAGSGKSNSIAWLAHRLSSLHTDDNEKIYYSVVVVTDRRVLDQQLQDTIYQFEHKQGVVVKIDENTRQLVGALINGTSIIITTLQKFPFVSETLEKLNKEKENGQADVVLTTAGKRFAIIVDEAHSSQSGETAADLRAVLNQDGIGEAAGRYVLDNEEAEEDSEIIRTMLRRNAVQLRPIHHSTRL